MDRLQSMRVFSTVVEQGSFARAAQVLNMSNATVTRHVADLETHLGARLLNRTTRKLSLTETGHAYLEKVTQILQDIDDVEAIVSSQSQNPAGTLRIFSSLGFGQSQLARLLPLYARKYPDIVLDVTLSDRTADLVEDGYDIGIFTNLHKFDAGMVARQLAVSELLLCASPSYVKRHGAPQVPEDISQHACLNYAFPQTRHYWPIGGQDNGSNQVRVDSRLISNSEVLLRESALAGIGLMIRPSFGLGDDLAGGRLVRLLQDHFLGQVSVMMVYPSRRLLSATVRSFVDFMSAKFPNPEHDPWLSAADRVITAVRGERTDAVRRINGRSAD